MDDAMTFWHAFYHRYRYTTLWIAYIAYCIFVIRIVTGRW